jgi:hypothetical protein
MNLSIKPCVRWLALLALVLTATVARADFITGTLDDVNGQGVYGGILSPGASAAINLGDGTAPSINYYPGVVNWTVEKAPTNKPNASWVPSVGSSYTTFCIELTQNISPGHKYTYQLTDLGNAPKPGSSQTQTNGPGTGMGTTKADAIENLWAQFYSSSFTNDQAAAFQLDIWKIEYDWGDGSNFSSGYFQATASSDIINQATKWLNQVDPNSNNLANLIALTNPYHQDQVMEGPPVTPSISTTPAPSTLVLTAVGGSVLLLYARRRRMLGALPG